MEFRQILDICTTSQTYRNTQFSKIVKHIVN